MARRLPPAEPFGDAEGDLLVVGWGGTYGALHAATLRARAKGLNVSHLHLRYINPFPANLGEVLGRFQRLLVPELNLGQLALLLRERFLVKPLQLNKVQGQPFLVSEVLEAIENALQENAK